ncbi:MAG TPA: YHS domain-containing protein [Methanosarcina sp.]|nr:YHS domain-containing protein [Methanosarcina sp.]
MKILKIMAMLLAVVAVVSTAGCTEKAQVAGNETQEASEQVTTAAAPTTSAVKSVPSVTPSAKNNTDLTSSTVVDVVCKMKIDKRTAEFISKYKGKTYYFCALSCKKEFDENPEKYINSENKENDTLEASEQVMSAATNSANSTSSTVVDVVCKMQIDKNAAEFTSEYKGKTYYFCVLSCKKKFDENPEKYIGSETAEDNSDTTENESQETSEYETQEASVTSATNNSTYLTFSTVTDVVCKMEIDKNTAEFMSEYKGTTYYFCALSCKQEFDKNPEKYIGSEAAENNFNATENESQEDSEQITSTNNSTDSMSSTVVDVVCKMEIDKRTAEFTSEYEGTIYYFCSASCKKEFDENPEKYINSGTTENETQKNCKITENKTLKNCKTTENKIQKNCKTTENKTQKASEQVTSATTNDTDSTSSTAIDVVCKMQIDKRTAEFKSKYKGTMYYFCSASCKKKFDGNSKKFINSKTTENNSRTTENNSRTTENNSKTTENNSKTTENKTQEASEQVTSADSKTTENETQEASEQVTPIATNSTDSTSSTVVDVVCKMEIDKRTAEFTSEYKGTTYYFCSASCKKKFDGNPEEYT